MVITQSITLDLSNVNGTLPAIKAKQGDKNTRFVRVRFTDNNLPYAIPAGVSAEFRCLKADGHSVKYPVTINADNSLTVELSDQALAAPGQAKADIVLTNAGGDILSSASFAIIVEAVPIGSEILSSNEYLELTQTLAQGKTLLGQMETIMPVVLTQAEYNALSAAGELNPETLYLIARDDL